MLAATLFLVSVSLLIFAESLAIALAVLDSAGFLAAGFATLGGTGLSLEKLS
jgi:hypothetical protein